MTPLMTILLLLHITTLSKHNKIRYSKKGKSPHMEPGQDNPIGTGKRVRDISTPLLRAP